ncbi:MAG: hypothetical protein JW861_11260 [Bacteroidales bacterium]|nr:hypothetical protein [Bacteroidales bacterium]
MRTGILYLAAILTGGYLLLTAGTNYSGGLPGGKTGSPGDNFATCTQCHNGTAIPQAGWITSNIPPEGYMAGETYSITATGLHNGAVLCGFEFTAEDGLGEKTGTFIITDPVQTKISNTNASVTHTSDGINSIGNGKSWSFDWTAPAAGSGPVIFYSAVNVANGTGNPGVDVIYTSSLEVEENTTPPTIIHETTGSEFMTIGPNPFKEHAEVRFDTGTAQKADVFIFDTCGKLTGKMTWSSSAAHDNSLEIGQTMDKPGMYAVSVIINRKMKYSHTLVKV